MPLTGPHTPGATSAGQGMNVPIWLNELPPTQQRVPPIFCATVFGLITAVQLPTSEPPRAAQSWVSNA